MIKVNEIVEYLTEQGISAEYTGSADAAVDGYCAITEPRDGCITWCKNKSYLADGPLDERRDMLLIAGEKSDKLPESIGVIVTSHPKAAFFSVVRRFFVPRRAAVIARDAVVETDSIGENVSIGHFSYICAECVIGNNVTIGNNVSIECPAQIGDNCVIGSGTVIGTEGYGYYEDSDGIQQRVPHTGGVRIGSSVEIGANVCIDRGTIGDTVLEDYVKVSNLCQIAHNVVVGKHTMILAMTVLAGSCRIGERAYIAPGAMVMNQKTVGGDSLVGMGSLVVKNVPENKVVSGVPAKVMRDKDWNLSGK